MRFIIIINNGVTIEKNWELNYSFIDSSKIVRIVQYYILRSSISVKIFIPVTFCNGLENPVCTA